MNFEISFNTACRAEKKEEEEEAEAKDITIRETI